MNSNFKLKRLSDGEEFELSNISLLVGRSESCDICVTEGHPSREHARVAERDGAVLVQDLHSTNGTYVNNKRIEVEAALQPGDVVKFGDEAFSVQQLDAPEATVLMRSLGAGENANAMVIDDEDEDEEDADSTSILEVYAMPAGWDVGGFDTQIGKLDDKKKLAIDRYVDKFNQSLKGKTGIFLIFFSDDNPPVFKSLIAKDGKDTWTFGRAEDSDVSLENPCISKHHANIEFKGSSWKIIDKESTNGLTAKGKRVPELALEDEGRFEISSVDVLVKFLK